jgi:gluconate 5-dehydrogenase
LPSSARTGASQGIGLAIAEGLAAADAALILNGRSASKLEAAAEGLRAKGAIVAVAPFDVTDGAAALKQNGLRQTRGGSVSIIPTRNGRR